MQYKVDILLPVLVNKVDILFPALVNKVDILLPVLVNKVDILFPALVNKVDILLVIKAALCNPYQMLWYHQNDCCYVQELSDKEWACAQQWVLARSNMVQRRLDIACSHT